MGMSGRQTLLSIAVAVAIIAPFSPKVASADQVEAIVTCDNAYGFGWGPTTGMGAGSYSGPVLNTSSATALTGCPALTMNGFAYTPGSPPDASGGNNKGVERWVITNPPALEYFYVIADSDDAQKQGFLGEFHNLKSGGSTVYSGDADWEVCATGNNKMPPNTMADFPNLSIINAEILKCNQNDPTNKGSSGGWVTDSKGIDANSLATLGRLYPSQSQRPSAVNDGAQGRPYGLVPCISPAAAWMWFDRGAPNSPTVPDPCQGSPTGFPNQKEFLIFRLPIKSVVGESDPCPTVDIKMIGTLTCHSGLTGTGSSGCYDIKIRVKNNGPADITHLTIRPAKGDPLVITRLVTKGTTQDFIVTICTPLSGVGSWLDVSPVFKGEGICCSERLFVDIPRCPPDPCLNIAKTEWVHCDPDGLPGSFQVKLKVQVGSPGTLFVLNPDDSKATMSPAGYTLNVSGSYTPIFTIHDPSPAKSSPRVYCMALNMLPKVSSEPPYGLSGDCCSRTICFEVPFCGLPTPKPGIPPLADAAREVTPEAPGGVQK